MIARQPGCQAAADQRTTGNRCDGYAVGKGQSYKGIKRAQKPYLPKCLHRSESTERGAAEWRGRRGHKVAGAQQQSRCDTNGRIRHRRRHGTGLKPTLRGCKLPPQGRCGCNGPDCESSCGGCCAQRPLTTCCQHTERLSEVASTYAVVYCTKENLLKR